MERPSSRKTKWQKIISWLTLATFTLQPTLAAAQAVADPNAAAGNRPVVDSAQNGTPVVQIAKPSAAGVSRNLYQQFDIDPKGLILNNSLGIAKTQLAGYIQGNANLTGGSARLILNEVTGANISNLRGYLEVAGQKADVILANPNGIVGNGFGFINTGRGILTTGVPVFGGSGSLEAFRVTGGQIAVEGSGINGNGADRVDLISRAVAVNAGIWANELNVVTGANEVNANTLATKAIQGDGAQPQVAIDVSALGGMYAGKIQLVGTEKGVGVNSQGTLAASSGDLILNNDGQITLAGAASAAGNIQVASGADVHTSGVLYAKGTTNVNSTGDIINTGTVASGQSTQTVSKNVTSTGVLGAGVDENGNITTAGNLVIQADSVASSTGKTIAGGNLSVIADSIDLSNGKTEAGGQAVITALNGDINNTGASLYAGGALTLSANGSIKNDRNAEGVAGEIRAGKLNLTANTISNQGGSLLQQGAEAAQIKAAQKIDNTGGKIATNGTSITLEAAELQNNKGAITGDGSIAIAVSQMMNNQQGTVEAKHGLSIDAGSLANQSGKISSLDDSGLTIQVDTSITNDSGGIGGNGQVTIGAGNLSNKGGSISAQTDLSVSTTQGIDNTQGSLAAGRDFTVTHGTALMDNTQGNVAAVRTLSISGSQVNNAGGKLGAGENAVFSVQNIQGAGEIKAGQDLVLTGDFMNGIGNQMKANRDILSSAGVLNNQGTMEAVRNLMVSGSSVINGTGASMTASEELSITATGAVSNSGSMTSHRVTVAADTITNTGSTALIGAAKRSATDPGELNLYARTSLANQDSATLYSQGNLTIAGAADKDSNGQFTTKTSSVLNESSTVEAENDMVISTNALTNKKGPVVTGEHVLSSADYTGKGVYRKGNLYLIDSVDGTSAKNLTPYKRVDITGVLWLISESISETYIIQDAPLSSIKAGQNLILDAPLITNNQSEILAANNLTTLLGVTVNNITGGNQKIIRRTIVNSDSYFYVLDQGYDGKGPNYIGMETPTSFGMRWQVRGYFGGQIGEAYVDTVAEQLSGGAPAVIGGGQQVTLQGTVNNTVVAPSNGITTTPQALLPTAPGVITTPPQSTGGGSVTLPQNALYTVHTEPTAKYLVEANPKFASYGTFMSSDYILGQLNIDPASTIKRLGDGFYEQKLVQDQITQLTGRVYLAGYSDANEEYKALMTNGTTYAKNFNLTVGVALTQEQMNQLTTDMVWLVEKEVNGQKVLEPVVYLAHLSKDSLKADGSIIVGDNVSITGDQLTNSGTIKASNSLTVFTNNIVNQGGTIASDKDVSLTANEDITNISGKITGDNLTLAAGRDIRSETYTAKEELPFLTRTIAGDTAIINATNNLTTKADRDVSFSGTQVTAGQNVSLTAGRDLTLNSVETIDRVTTGSRYLTENKENVLTGIQAGGSINLKATKGDLTLKGVQASAGTELNVTASGNVNIGSVKDEVIKDIKTGSSRNWKRTMTDDETVIGSNLQAGGNVTISAVGSGGGSDPSRGNVTITGSNVTSDTGKITISADNNVTIQAESEKHEALTQSHKKKSGMFSSKTKDKLDHSVVNEVVGSTISGDTVAITSGKDLTVKGSNVVGTNDVTLKATNDVNLETAAETGASEHYSRTKKSGLFSGGGLGFTIGSQSEKTTLKEQTLGQVGSTVGSIAGNVNITAGNDLNSQGTTLVSGKDINLTGKEVTLDNSIDTYDSQYKYEFKQSGLTVSLNGGVVTSALNAASEVRRSGEVEDDRLQALYAYKAYEDIKSVQKQIADGSAKSSLSVNVSIGSSKMTQEQTTHVETVNSSNVTAGGNVTVTATEKDINLAATNITGKDVTLDAKKGNVNIEAAQNISENTSKTSSSSWSLGGSFGLGTGSFMGVTGSAQAGKSKENGITITNSGSNVNASDTLTIHSGADTNIIGSQVSGEKVEIKADGNLNIASLQDSDTYKASSQSAGIGFGTGKISGTHGSIGTSKTNSTYDSVTDQAGIYAGKEGFDINVGKNTDLKGAVISSEAGPDKNKLSTDTLTFGDIQNKAQYSASSQGVNYAAGKDANGNPVATKDLGLTPNIGVTVSGNADSTTKSAVSPGTIEVRSNPNQDLSGLSRDPAGALNALGKIFDKKSVQEKQELAQLFGELAYKKIGDLAIQNGWVQGGSETTALHALVGGIMAQLGGGSFASGAVGAGVSDALQKELSNIKDPALRQWASAIVGAAASSTIGNAQTGASTAASGVKNNDENVHEVTIGGIAFLISGVAAVQIINGQKTLVVAGQAIATWASDTGGWVKNEASNLWGSLVLWAKRGSNNLGYDENASGPHTTYKRDPVTGEVTSYRSWDEADPRNPNPYEPGIGYDGQGKSHYNKETGEWVDTPHVHDPDAPGGVRKPNPEEIPEGGTE